MRYTKYSTISVSKAQIDFKNFMIFSDEHFWVDEYSKIIFPVCFAIFNIVFWTYSLAFDHTLLEEIQAAGYEKL